MNDDEENKSVLPVSPTTGLDPEIRQFISRVMAGYEGAHRTIADLCETIARDGRETREAFAKTIRMQIELAQQKEEALSRNHKRELEERMALRREESFGALTTEARSVLTLAAKKWMGIPLTGNDSHGLQDLLKTLSGDQIEALMTSGVLQLSDAQRQMLAATLTSLADNEKKQLPEAAE